MDTAIAVADGKHGYLIKPTERGDGSKMSLYFFVVGINLKTTRAKSTILGRVGMSPTTKDIGVFIGQTTLKVITVIFWSMWPSWRTF